MQAQHPGHARDAAQLRFSFTATAGKLRDTKTSQLLNSKATYPLHMGEVIDAAQNPEYRPASIPSPLTNTIGELAARHEVGFIQPDTEGDNICFPSSSLEPGEAQRLQVGMHVSYEYSRGKRSSIAPRVWILPG